ncbi:hypothetical protein [Owenweeksia hongkongensis]|uniref:hypothetical protein n=1 Tax=Owenweeksia hongkongensis TaxID=253245 RepID=UPI003A8DAD1C
MSEMNEIHYKKPIYEVSHDLHEYLVNNSRCTKIPIEYSDLMRYNHLIPKLDKDDSHTLWNSVLYGPSEMEEIYEHLVDLYQILIGDGSHLDYLTVDSVDFCAYGNSQPFRIKILNQINDNYDYYYIKKADASRVYGLELEHFLSPNKINYIYYNNTLVEEHIIGIPGDDFMDRLEQYNEGHNEVRLAKEFVKFNERCFVRLLGDMRAYNWVVVVNQDFDQIQYRIRSIDFDQQNYEGRHRIYLPQFYKENLPYVRLTQKHMSIATAQQYVNEEQALLRKRYKLVEPQITELMHIMKRDKISKDSYIKQLGAELARFYDQDDFRLCNTMGEVLELNIHTRLNF